MKMNFSAVVLSAVAFFTPVAAYADEVTDLKPGQSATGFINPAYGFDQRTELWNTKELVIRHNGVLKRLNVTKYICVPTCYYKIEYVGNIEPKQQINYYDMNQLLRPNSGGQNVPDSEVEKKAKEMGVEKERLKKALADKNEMARLIREIEVKRAEQKKKEKDDQEKQGKGGGGGSSGGGGGSSGGGGGSSGGGGGSSGGGGGGSSGGGGGGSSGGGGGGSSGGGGGSSGGGGGSSGGGGGSSGGGGGGSSGGGSHAGGGSHGGGGSSGGHSSGGDSSNGVKKTGNVFKYVINGQNQSNVNPYTMPVLEGYTDRYCNQTYSSLSSESLSKLIGINLHDEQRGSKMSYSLSCSYVSGGVKDIVDYTDDSSECKSTRVVKQDTGKGSFSILCTKKNENINFGGPSVGSLGGNSSTSSNNSTSSSSSGSGAGSGGSVGGGASGNKGNGAGATAGGNGANDGGRAPSAGGGTAQNSSDSNSNKTDSSNSGKGNSKMGGSDDPGKKSDSSSGGSNGSNSGGNADGNGDGSGSEQYGLPDVPDVPDGGGEPDWNGIKSDGNFGTFSPSSAFATGGQCPQDILLDFGQFGRHSLSWSPICEAAQRLRYVFITLAYFMAAMMVYKTVNSMRG